MTATAAAPAVMWPPRPARPAPAGRGRHRAAPGRAAAAIDHVLTAAMASGLLLTLIAVAVGMPR